MILEHVILKKQPRRGDMLLGSMSSLRDLKTFVALL